MVFSLTSRLSQLPIEQREVASKRIEMIHNAQRRLGMEPRDDSQLTYNYAIGILNDDEVPSAIANELVVVDRIYRTTEYGTLVEDVLREIAAHIRRKYRLPWTTTWDIVRFYGPTLFKLYCIKSEQTI